MDDPQGRRICVMGLGYIGLPTAALLAAKGLQVHGVDRDPRVVETIDAGRVHIHEPDLDSLVKSAVHSGHLKADIDDLRESPAVEIALQLAREGSGYVLAVEPHIDNLPTPLAEAGVELCEVKKALAQADILLGLVPHKAFKQVSPQALQEKIVIDTCGVWR